MFEISHGVKCFCFLIQCLQNIQHNSCYKLKVHRVSITNKVLPNITQGFKSLLIVDYPYKFLIVFQCGFCIFQSRLSVSKLKVTPRSCNQSKFLCWFQFQSLVIKQHTSQHSWFPTWLIIILIHFRYITIYMGIWAKPTAKERQIWTRNIKIDIQKYLAIILSVTLHWFIFNKNKCAVTQMAKSLIFKMSKKHSFLFYSIF